MNINYKEVQSELFPVNSASLDDMRKPPFLLASLTLSIESLVIFSILAIMIALFSFSLGVERGRTLAAQSLDEKAAAAWNVGGRKPAPAVPLQPKVSAVQQTAVRSSASVAVAPKAVSSSSPVGRTAVVASAKWTVQLSSYRSEKYAQQEALGLKAKGYPTFIMKSKEFYLVCVGQFASQAQAQSFFKKIQAKHQGGQVRRF